MRDTSRRPSRVHHGRQEWKAGVESDNIFLHERFNDTITDFSQFDEDTPATFSCAGDRPDLEQSAFVQDLIRLDKWTVSAGLRWDHYQLLVNQNALSPRLGVSRYFPGRSWSCMRLTIGRFKRRSSRTFCSPVPADVVSLSDQVLRLPVKPSHGNYYERGFTNGFFCRDRRNVNYFDRRMDNFADDDQLLDTAVSFPIAFQKSNIYGAEGKLDLPYWGQSARICRFTARLQADAENINNRFNLVDFAGLFSGSAIEPPRSYALRLTNTF